MTKAEQDLPDTAEAPDPVPGGGRADFRRSGPEFVRFCRACCSESRVCAFRATGRADTFPDGAECSAERKTVVLNADRRQPSRL